MQRPGLWTACVPLGLLLTWYCAGRMCDTGHVAMSVCGQVESRPMRSRPVAGDGAGGRQFQYLFHIDFAGNLGEETPQNALRHLAEFAPYLRVLGCYPLNSEA